MDKRIVLAIMIPFCCASAIAQQSTGKISPAAKTYLEQALDLMQQNALHKKSIDWPSVREQTLSRATNAKTTWDTYPAIAYAITQLDEHHTWFQLPDNLPSDRRRALDAEIAKIVARSSPGSPSPFMPSKEIKGHMIGAPRAQFAYVVVPMCIPRYAEWDKNGSDFQEFADTLHGIVAELEKQKPDGWIIDLRGNCGGNMWPMLAGIGAVLGEGDLGAFISADGDRTPWHYKAGVAESASNHEAQIQNPPLILPGTPPVAILFDRGTASSGEAVAISFAGRPKERSFGEHTAGFSTSNGMYPLSDGASLFLCNGVEIDRTGKVYPDGLDPDVAIAEPAARPAEDTDAAILAAEEWLTEENRLQP